MTIINLKEWALDRGFSNYHIRCWIRDGLPIVRQRPYLTTQEALDKFFQDTLTVRNCRKKTSKKLAYKTVISKTFDYNDYVRGDYK